MDTNPLTVNQSPFAQQPPFQEPQQKKGSNVPLLIILGILLLGFGLLGGFFIGEYRATMLTMSPTPTPIQAVISEIPTTEPDNVLPSPTPAFEKNRSIAAGLPDSDVFEMYTVDVPIDWTDARESTVVAGLDKLTLTKGGATVTIYQAPMEGIGCLYGETPAATFTQTFDKFVDINGKSGAFRRSFDENEAKTTTYSICQKGANDLYNTITSFGAISVVAPNPADEALLTEIDGIIATLMKQ